VGKPSGTSFKVRGSTGALIIALVGRTGHLGGLIIFFVLPSATFC